MPAQTHKLSPAKRKANAAPVATPPQKKKPAAKPSPAKRTSNNDDDFIMTLDSDDEVVDLDAVNADADAADSASESEPDTPAADEKLTKNQRKRKDKAHLAGKEKIVESVSARSNNAAAAAKDSMALDKHFEFDIFGDGSGADYQCTDIPQKSNGWDMSVNGHRMHKKLNVDDIIEKRRKTRPQIQLPESDDDESDDASDDASDALDDDIKFAEFGDSDDEDDEAGHDRFGGGNGTIIGDDQDDDEAAEIDSEEDPLSTDEEEASDDGDDDDQVQDQEDAESNSSDDDSDEETEQEKAKKAAFFADEPSTSAKAKASDAAESSFASFSLSRPVLRALSSLSFHKPTPIQSRTIPIALAGKDIVAGAVTGSGKTAAFMIPAIERLTWRAKGRAQEAKSRVLILAPTRELAIQCYSVGKSIAKFTDIRFCLCVGGLSVKSQEAELKLRPEVVIATPGRLIDHVRNSASFTLDDIEILVMDEADRMLEDGFADELNEIVKSCPKGARQTMLFSATMTDDVEQLVGLSLKRPVRLFVDPKRTTAKKLVQEFVRVRGTGTGGVAGADGLAGVGQEASSSAPSGGKRSEDAQRPALLLALCTRTFTSQVIIFVRSKKLAHQLKIVFGLLGLSAGELHGDLSQEQRIDALTAFRDGKVDFLIATDLASRGLDIKGVQTVINYDMPGQFEAYLHRVGRTARAGRNGRAVTLVGEADRRMLKLAIKKSSADQIKHRIIPAEVASKMLETLEELKPEVDAVLREEKEEKALRIAEMELKKGENMVAHADEIFGRPKRTWFQTGADKDKAATLSKAQYEATMEAKKKDAPARDKYAGLSRKKRRSKMMRDEIERENQEARASGGAKTASGSSLNASVRAAKKAQRPTKLGVAPVKVANGKGAKGSGGKKVKSSFSRDLTDKKRR